MPILNVIPLGAIMRCGYLSVDGEKEFTLWEGLHILPEGMRYLEYHSRSAKMRGKNLPEAEKDICIQLKFDEVPEYYIIEWRVPATSGRKKVILSPSICNYCISKEEYEKMKEKALLSSELRQEII